MAYVMLRRHNRQGYHNAVLLHQFRIGITLFQNNDVISRTKLNRTFADCNRHPKVELDWYNLEEQMRAWCGGNSNGNL